MKLLDFFKRKKNSIEEKLIDYIYECKKMNISEERIKERFKEENYPNDLIEKVFFLAKEREEIKRKKDKEKEINKLLKKCKKKDRKILRELYYQYEKGNVLKIEDGKKK